MHEIILPQVTTPLVDSSPTVGTPKMAAETTAERDARALIGADEVNDAAVPSAESDEDVDFTSAGHDPDLTPTPLAARPGISQGAWDARRRHEFDMSSARRVLAQHRAEAPAARQPKTPRAARARSSARPRSPARPSSGRATGANKSSRAGTDPPPPSADDPEPPLDVADGETDGRTVGAVSVQRVSRDSKLCCVEWHTVIRKDGKKGLKLVNSGATCASNYVAMNVTCPEGCPWKAKGDCYPVASGPATKNLIKRLNEAAQGHSSREVIEELVYEIDHTYVRGVPQDGPRGGGRPFRLNVAGDFRSEAEARKAGGGLTRWRWERGGGIGWLYTHGWREIRREAFGPDISALASVETIDEIEQAFEQGYASALTVKEFPQSKPYRLPGVPWRFIPCPHEVKKNALDIKRIATGMSDEEYEAERRGLPTCMDCGLCLDANKRCAKREVILFEEHGPTQAKKRNRRLRESEDLLQVGLHGPRPLPTAAGRVGASEVRRQRQEQERTYREVPVMKLIQ